MMGVQVWHALDDLRVNSLSVTSTSKSVITPKPNHAGVTSKPNHPALTSPSSIHIPPTRIVRTQTKKTLTHGWWWETSLMILRLEILICRSISMRWRRHEDVWLTRFLHALSSARSEWHFECGLWVQSCASHWSLPPGVLVVTVPSSSSKVWARAHALRYTHPHRRQCLSPPHASVLPLGVVFTRQLCCRLTILIIPLYILSESIYHQYLYSPSVMTDGCHTVVSSHTVSLTTLSHFTSTIVHNIRTLNSQLRRIIPTHAVQNNSSCCIQYISRR